jgi:hypothetical protein
MIGIVKQITELFRKPKIIMSPKERLLQKVLDAVDERRKHDEHCILLVTPIGVTSQSSATRPASVALIGHDKISDFQETLLYIEDRLVKDGHYCIIKLADDKSYANMFIYIDESILTN